jgi:hypothetical protein
VTADELKAYLQTLTTSPRMQSLWLVKDRGMPVFAHTVDVTLLCLDAFARWRESYPGLDLPAVVVGALLHDLSKLDTSHLPTRSMAPTRWMARMSHTQIMNAQPGLAVDQAVALLDELAARGGPRLSPSCLEHVKHIVASHHGRWGKVRPRTPEALLVHHCDYHSAIHHRLAPVDANDILPLLSEGCRWPQVSARLGIGRAVVKARLEESCRAELVRDWVDLMAIWRARGRVCAGSPERLRQLERARLVIQLAREVPDCLMAAIRPLLTEAGGSALSGEAAPAGERR